jgi:hypothetical protein
VADGDVGATPMACLEVTGLAAGFVLGALEPAEMAAVRAHLASCPQPHTEFEELGSTTPALLDTVELVEPPAALKNRILEAARADRDATRPIAAALVPAAAHRAPRDIPTTRSLRERLGLAGGSGSGSQLAPGWAVLGLAAVLAVVVLGARDLQLQASNEDLAAYQRGVAAALDAAARPGGELAVLKASEPSSPAAGLAGIRPDGTVAIAIRGLAPTTGSQVYEAWLVGATAAPIPIGGFAVDSSGSGTLTVPQGASTPGIVVALTLEPGPGATTPTLPLIATGTAQAQPG